MAVPKPLRLILVAVLSIALAGCGGGDDDASGDSDTTEPAQETDSSSEDAGAPSDAEDADASNEEASSGGNGGVLVLGDETIVLDSARCFLEEQDAAAGGGKILFVGQGFGTTAAGENVIVDVSRFDEDSQFTGDDIIVDIGEIGASVSWNVTAELGTVQIDGNVMRADGLTLTNWDEQLEAPGSFELNC